LWDLVLNNERWLLFIAFNIVKIFSIGLRILVLSDTWLVKLQILNLVILNMKNFRLGIALIEIVRLLCYELEITRSPTGIMNIFQYHQFFFNKMFF
jgi:hypothetical protein